MGRKGNPSWGKPVPFGPVVPTVTSFEEAVKELEEHRQPRRTRIITPSEKV